VTLSYRNLFSGHLIMALLYGRDLIMSKLFDG
jgi:hypothetical protein